jgi:hypothetical protein
MPRACLGSCRVIYSAQGQLALARFSDAAATSNGLRRRAQPTAAQKPAFAGRGRREVVYRNRVRAEGGGRIRGGERVLGQGSGDKGRNDTRRTGAGYMRDMIAILHRPDYRFFSG